MSYILKICPTRFVLILAGIKERKMKGAYKFAMLILNVVSAALCVIAIAGIIFRSADRNKSDRNHKSDGCRSDFRQRWRKR